MPSFQFFKRHDSGSLTYLDVDSATFADEKSQLLEQGFEVANNHYIQAATAEEALTLAAQPQLEALDSYGALTQSMIGVYELIKAPFRK
ncbi:hypothetical protein [Motilimonas cestriensis]|uniref:hypothetical protein n=1 Tax=Motilimonas cestriensis TaxID=2742685 RepID=UPI003DA4546E